MKFKIIISIFFIKLIFSIGLEGLNIPISSDALSTHNLNGLGTYNFNEIFNSKSYLEYNSRKWLPGFSGHSILWKNADNFIKAIIFETLKDDEVYYHSNIPNDKNQHKLPASWYSGSIFTGKVFYNIQAGLELKSFASLLYTEKIYGLCANLFLSNRINNNLVFNISLKNNGIMFGDLNNQNFPVQIALQLRNQFSNIPLLIGLGAINSSLEKSRNLVIKYDFKYININTSINNINNNYIQYAGGINFLYNDWYIGYSLSTQKSSTLGIPQIISLRYNF